MGKPKSYVEELEDWLQRDRVNRPRRVGDISFLAVRGDVKSARERGYSMKSIWRHLHALGRYPLRYETFLRHATKHSISAHPGTTETQIGPKPPAEPKASGFNFTASPKKEDLI